MNFPKNVYIRELGPREGFQTLDRAVPTDQKLRLIEALNLTGVREIEICSFVRPDKVPQMADAEEIARQFEIMPGVRYVGLYLNKPGFDRAETTGRLQNHAWLYTAACETFLQRNSNQSRAEVIKTVEPWVEAFNKAGKSPVRLMVSAAFGSNYEGPVELDNLLGFVSDVADELARLGTGLGEICLADTMGWANPLQVKSFVIGTRDAFPESEVSLHLHDTRGTGMANVFAGLEVGVSTFDSSVGGIGGCPFAKGAAGNVCTEDIVVLCRSLGIETGINVEAYVMAARIAEEIIGAPLPGKFYKSWESVKSWYSA